MCATSLRYVNCLGSTKHVADALLATQLPDEVQDTYREIFGVSATADVLRFCKSQLIHEIWLLLLNEEFMDAYRHGVLILCADKILRRLFPRFVTYSADYPEQ